jgi:hypothetical protein
LSKIELEEETPEIWYERWVAIQKAPWIWLDREEWVHMHTGNGGHPANKNRLTVSQVRISMQKILVNPDDVSQVVRDEAANYESRLTACPAQLKVPQVGSSSRTDLREEVGAKEPTQGVENPSKPEVGNRKRIRNRNRKSKLDKEVDSDLQRCQEVKYESTYKVDTVRRQFGDEAAELYRRLEEKEPGLDIRLMNGYKIPPKRKKPSKAASMRCLANEVVESNEMFFTHIMRVGEIHKFNLRSLCFIVGLVAEGANKWLKRSKPANRRWWQNLTSYNARTLCENTGLWLLTAENAAKDYKIESKHKLISHLQPSKVNYKGREVTVLTGRRMREYMVSSYFPMEDEQVFMLRILDKEKPLAKLMTHITHLEMGCGLGKDTYHDTLLRHGFHWEGANNAAEVYRSNCHSCKIQSAAMRNLSQVVIRPGADYTINEIFSKDPLSAVCIDETGPVRFQDGGKGLAMMVVEVVTKRVHLIAMSGTSTEELVNVLERLQARRGGLRTVILDAHPTHETIANSSTVSTKNSYLRQKLNNKWVKRKLQKKQIQIKLVGDNDHHQCGMAEMISRKVKVYVYNVCHGLPFRNGIHYQSVLDKMAGAINARVLFIDTEGYVHSADTFLQAAAQVSRDEPQVLTDLPNTTSSDIIKRVKDLADETRRILVLWGSHYMKCLLAWKVKTHGTNPAIRHGDVVICLDMVQMHHYRSARRAIGRVVAICPRGQTFTIQMASRGAGDRGDNPTKHVSHIMLLARCHANQGKPVNVDVLADEDVSNYMAQDRKTLTSAFHTDGLEKLPAVKQMLKEAAKHVDPRDEWIEEDLYTRAVLEAPKPPDAEHVKPEDPHGDPLVHQAASLEKEELVQDMGTQKPAKHDSGYEEYVEPDIEEEPAKPEVQETVSRSGRKVRRPRKFGDYAMGDA